MFVHVAESEMSFMPIQEDIRVFWGEVVGSVDRGLWAYWVNWAICWVRDVVYGWCRGMLSVVRFRMNYT